MTTPRRQPISMPDVLRPLLAEPGTDSNEPLLELSIASAQLEAHGAALDRITRRLSPGRWQEPCESSATGPTA